MKMKALIAAAFLAAASFSAGAVPAAGKTAAAAAERLTQEATENLVTVKVTYKNPDEWRPVFEVTMDSRFVNLDNVKFGDVAILYDDLGGTFRATEVSMEGVSDSHHKAATIKFGEANASSANSFELTIQRVADVGIRSFKFVARKGQPGSGF